MIQEPQENISAMFEEAMQKTGSNKIQEKLFNFSEEEEEGKIFFDAEKDACKWNGTPLVKLRKLSSQTYRSYHINSGELEYLCSFLKLENGMKHSSYADAQVIQTIEYMFHLRQEITSEAIEVLINMSNVKKMSLKVTDWGPFFFGDCYRTKFFLPPLEIAFNWMKRKQPRNYEAHLDNMFNGCSDIRNVEIFKELNPMFIAYHQIPIMMKIFEEISEKKSAYNLEKLDDYFNKNKEIFSVENENEVLDRFLPETKVLYLKAQNQKLEFSKDVTNYLLTLLKNAEELTEVDFQILFHSYRKGKCVTLNDKYSPQTRSFKSIEQKIMEIFTSKAQFIGVEFLMDIGNQLNFESCWIEDTILSYYILTLLSEVSYQGQVFPNELIQKLNDIMVKIPHDRIQKMICKILLCQKKNIEDTKNSEIFAEFKKIVSFTKMNELLNSGKLMAINLLEKAKFPEIECENFDKVLNDIIQKETDIGTVSKLIIIYWKLKGEKENLEMFYEELLGKNRENDEVFLKILKVRSLGSESLPSSMIEGIVKFIENNRGCKDSALQILINIFCNERQEINGSIIIRTFKIFVNSELFDVNKFAFKAMVKSVETKSFIEVVERVLEECEKSLKENVRVLKMIERQSQKSHSNLVPEKGVHAEMTTICERICYLVFFISKSLSKNKNSIRQKKDDIQSHICNIYEITRTSAFPNQAQNDIINSFNYLLMSEIDVPLDILESLNQAMKGKQEYSPYNQFTLVYNVIEKRSSQVEGNSSISGRETSL